jgi:hypothetical protein
MVAAQHPGSANDCHRDPDCGEKTAGVAPDRPTVQNPRYSLLSRHKVGVQQSLTSQRYPFLTSSYVASPVGWKHVKKYDLFSFLTSSPDPGARLMTKRHIVYIGCLSRFPRKISWGPIR